MASTRLTGVLKSLYRAIAVGHQNSLSDKQLLKRFVDERDEDAFVALVQRHGPLVIGVCRWVLSRRQDVEDVFQATFLTLAKQAAKVCWRESVAGWLHQVAYRLATKAKIETGRRRAHERQKSVLPEAEQPTPEFHVREIAAVLDEELQRLSDAYREPLVLCYLESKPTDQAARLLGCSLRTLQRRLEHGRRLLRARLTRRGFDLSIGLLTAGLTLGPAARTVPAALTQSTVKGALVFTEGPMTAGLISARAVSLAIEAIPTFSLGKAMSVVVGMIAVSALLTGAGVWAYRHPIPAGNAAEPPQPAGEPGGKAEVPRQPGARARVDCYGDPLPEYALARMGTTRLLWCRDGRDKHAAFSPDGKTLATQLDSMTVSLWDAATGKEIRRLTTKAVKGWIKSLGFSPDGKTLITVIHLSTYYFEEKVCWWEVATGKLLRKQEYQRSKYADHRPVDFLPGGKMLGFVSFRKPVKEEKEIRGAYVWDVATGKEICQLNRPLKDGEDGRATMTFSPDGKLLATFLTEPMENEKQEVEYKAMISLWDVGTGKEIRQLTYKADANGDITVALSPDGKTLAAGGIKKIRVWEVATGKKIHQFQPKEGGGIRNPLTFSPDGKTLAGGVAGHLWEVGTGKEIRLFGWKEAATAFFSPDGKILAVGDEAGAIRLWEVATGKEIGPRKGYRGGIRSVAYSPDGKTLASMGKDETVRLWEAATGKEMHSLAKNTHLGNGALAYSPDGKMLVSLDSTVLHLWDTATGKEIREFSFDVTVGNFPWSVVFSPDGKKLASGDNTIQVWEVATGKKIYSLSTGIQDSNYPRQIAFSTDGRLLATPGKENMVSLWEVATGKLIGLLGRPKKPTTRPLEEFFVRFLAFSPDGRMLATSGIRDDKIRVWEVASGEEIWQLDGLKNSVYGYMLAFSPDSRMLATAAQGTGRNGYIDPKVHLWEIASGKEIGQLTGHRAIVRTLAFSPDGKTLASGSDDLTCLVWDVTSFRDQMKPVLARPLPTQALSKEKLEAAWADLAKDPAKAYAAISVLQAVPGQAIALLQARVRPVAPLADPQQLKRWIADLGAGSFAVREKAQREIEKLGEPAIPALRQALKDRPGLEMKRRLNDLLTELESKVVGGCSPRCLRELRAVQVLEFIGTVEARQILQAWAKGVAGARLTVDAEAALARFAKRLAAGP